jgi:hypothetical protein
MQVTACGVRLVFSVHRANGRPLAKSGCGLRSSAARRITIACGETKQAIALSFPALLLSAIFFRLAVLSATRLTATAEKYTLALRHAQA